MTMALVVTRAAGFGERPNLPETTLVMANPANGCSPYAHEVANKVVLVRRGSCRFVTKARMAYWANASGLIVMDDMHRGEPGFNATDGIDDNGRWEVRMHSDDSVHPSGDFPQEAHLPPSVFVSYASGRRLERLVQDMSSSQHLHDVLVALNTTAEVYQPYTEDLGILELRLSTFIDLVYTMLPFMGYAYASSFCFVLLSTFYARAVETSASYTKQYVRRSIWRRLAVVPYGGPLHHGYTCSICLDDFVLGHPVKVLPCPHAYHQDCIDRWFEKGSNACPMCKREAFS
ncbi:hypothetical protein, variant 1 [Aphanomyces invadans]|uniref:RING-type domain-containing protein n=1 Tax=Aphanomyces invadans TaxID=157072 RepID=A0A024TJJ4_9STRA|nr:hypothetical protein, variant 1 [Aphanomyces invadans]ETV94223.1 hypothetical protein, variant 1 [Aphanomyces invadans]|eukprot:XP_008876984.1 hypothetical protein, variant 1 [Aphanomyces invadans]